MINKKIIFFHFIQANELNCFFSIISRLLNIFYLLIQFETSDNPCVLSFSITMERLENLEIIYFYLLPEYDFCYHHDFDAGRIRYAVLGFHR